MMARYGGGRPGSSRWVRLEPVRRSVVDHRAVARIVLALARQMAADEAVESAANGEVVSSGTEVCTGREPGTSDVSATGSGDAAAPWTGAHSGQSACGVALVGRCTANEPVSASAGSGSVGRCARQRHEGGRYLAHGTSSATSHVLPDRAGRAESGEATAASSVPGGTS